MKPVMKGDTKLCSDLLAMVWKRLTHNLQLYGWFYFTYLTGYRNSSQGDKKTWYTV